MRRCRRRSGPGWRDWRRCRRPRPPDGSRPPAVYRANRRATASASRKIVSGCADEDDLAAGAAQRLDDVGSRESRRRLSPQRVCLKTDHQALPSHGASARSGPRRRPRGVRSRSARSASTMIRTSSSKRHRRLPAQLLLAPWRGPPEGNRPRPGGSSAGRSRRNPPSPARRGRRPVHEFAHGVVSPVPIT